MSGNDPLLAQLQKILCRAGICSATTGVIEHFDLLSDGNRHFGSSVYVQTRDEGRPVIDDLRLGRVLHPGQREHFPHCDLICRRDGTQIIVVVVSHDGRELSRRLSCAATAAEAYDEALFLGFGPQEYLCTPWHDGEPQRQVITVDGLRAYAAAWNLPAVKV